MKGHQFLVKATVSALTVAGAAALAVLPGSAGFAQSNLTVVLTGLDNPRGLTFGNDGGLYVTEAGRGGTGSTITSGANTQVSYGTSSAVTRLLNGVQSRVLVGAPSLAVASGAEAAGLQDIVFVGNQAYGLIGLGANPNLRNTGFTASETGARLFGNIV